MENKLRAMFDYQKFENNPALQQVIDSVHSRWAVRELSMDEMEWVSAAGTPEIKPAAGKKPLDADAES